MTQNWTQLIEKLEKGLGKNQDDCKSAIGGLKLYFAHLEEDEDIFEVRDETKDCPMLPVTVDGFDGHLEYDHVMNIPLVTEGCRSAPGSEFQEFQDFEAASVFSSSSAHPETHTGSGDGADMESNDALSGGLRFNTFSHFSCEWFVCI